MQTIFRNARKAITRLGGRKHVFIVTYGRSGSTLLMNILNSTDGCCIRGENNGALYGLFQSYQRVYSAQSNPDQAKNSLRHTSPWFGLSKIDTKGYARKLTQSFVSEIIRPDALDFLVGFKEIRYSDTDVPDFDGFLKFITRFFPHAKIVFNHRNIQDVAKSKWWADHPNGLKSLSGMEEKFNAYTESDTFFHFSYDRAISDMSHVRELFDFLGVNFDQSQVEKVFSIRHSY